MNFVRHFSGISARTLFPARRFKYIGDTSLRRIVVTLPEPYQKFFAEWKDEEPEPVHWIPQKEKWERNPITGIIKPIQNQPIPVDYPNEVHKGLYGGEGVVEGLVKKKKYRSPVPRFWVPTLKRTVVYSEILDKYFSIMVTNRALELIDSHYGLDSYLLKTSACNLQSLMAFKLKRLILLALLDKDFCKDNPERQQELLEKYKPYMISREDADWYGLSVPEAQAKLAAIQEIQSRPVPLKLAMRLELLNVQ